MRSVINRLKHRMFINRNIIILSFISGFSLLIGNEELIERDFTSSGRLDAMITSESDDLKLIQLDLKNDTLYQIINENFPQLELFNGPASYHRIVDSNQYNDISQHVSNEVLYIIDDNYLFPDNARLYWVETKQGNNTYGTYTDDEAIEYTCACIGDQTNDCVKLGYDESWYNPFDYYGEAWWAFTPPHYDYIQEIRVTVRGAQCDDLPIWSESYMGLKDDNGSWSNDYELSINYTDNIFIVPSTWSQGMLMPTVGSEDNYVIDFVKFEFFYSCIDPDQVISLSASDEEDCSIVVIDWAYEDLSDLEGARLYRDGNLLFESTSLDELFFIDYTASDNTVHEYCIQTFNSCTSSDLVCNTGSLKPEPEAVSNVEAGDGNHLNEIWVTWSEADNVEGYKVYRDEVWMGLLYPHQALEYIDSYVDPGVVYNYCIESFNECGDSLWLCDTGFSSAYLGDANFDGYVDVLDVVMLVNFILLTDEPTDDQFFWLDINQDNFLNVQDVVLIVNIILD